MRISFALLLFTLISYLTLGQKDTAGNQEDLDGITETEDDPEVQVDVKKEFNENGDLLRFDSTYTWNWSGDPGWDSKNQHKFEEHLEHLREHMEESGEDFSYKLHMDQDLSMKLEDFFKRFEFMWGDSVNSKKYMDWFSKEAPFGLYEFDYNGLDFRHIPMDKDKLEELKNSIEDLFNNKFEERIQEFIEKHESQLDEILYEIHESIPRHGKAI